MLERQIEDVIEPSDAIIGFLFAYDSNPFDAPLYHQIMMKAWRPVPLG
jgi:hypothetical protein